MYDMNLETATNLVSKYNPVYKLTPYQIKFIKGKEILCEGRKRFAPITKTLYDYKCYKLNTDH